MGAILAAFPGGCVEQVPDPEDSYFSGVYEGMRDGLSRIKGARLLYEREPVPGPEWSDHLDPEEDPPDLQEYSSSYHLFFISPVAKVFEYEVEGEQPDENGELVNVRGTGCFGFTVGVSTVAPYAVIRFDQMESLEDGSQMLPDIHNARFAMDGTPLDMEEHLGEIYDRAEIDEMYALRDRIAGILDSHGVGVLTEEDERKVVPGLTMGEDIFFEGMDFDSKPGSVDVTVSTALFFQEL